MSPRYFRVRNEVFAALSAPAELLPARTTLTPAEAWLLAAVAAGSSNAEIARTRRTSLSTVNNQLSILFRKLGVRSRSELVLRCSSRKEGLET